jgi:hypothetical protein
MTAAVRSTPLTALLPMRRQILGLRLTAVGVAIAGPLAFFAVAGGPAGLVLGSLAVVAACAAGFAPASPLATVSLLSLAGELASTADGRSQAGVLVIALLGAAALWAQHTMWNVAAALPRDAQLEAGALRPLLRRAAVLLTMAWLVEVVMLATADAVSAGASWRWVGVVSAGLLCLAPTLLAPTLLLPNRRSRDPRDRAGRPTREG